MNKKIIIALTIIAISASFIFLPVEEYIELFVGWANENPLISSVVYMIIYIAACIFFIPGSVITLVAGFIFGLVHGVILVSISSTIGAVLAFVIGRTIARDWVGNMISEQPKFKALDSAIEKKGFLVVLLTRLSPLFPFNFLNYAFGLTGVSLGKYFLASWLGMIPGTILYVYLGSISKNVVDLVQGNVDSGLTGQILLVIGLIATVIVTVVVTRIAKRMLNEQLQE
ncbi:MAG: TVP38/TMEM64 family protein [Gammaproteobacteria bacterium]|nr:MAG: TVP38/TMEM64 family protein [Gammaproteobacteria bacterium]